jgi:PAS domain S-box-containing protein
VTNRRFAHKSELYESGSVQYDHSYTVNDAVRKELCTSVSLMRNKSGQAIGYVGITHDLTQLIKQTKATTPSLSAHDTTLMDSDYLEIINSTTEGSWVFDLSTGIIHYSDKWARRIGLPLSNAINYREVNALAVHPDDQVLVHDAMVQVIQSRNTKYRVQFRTLTRDKGYIWVLNQGTVFYNSENKPYKIVGIALDISEIKQMELQLEAQAEMLQRTITDLKGKEQEYLMLLDTGDMGFFVDDLVNGTLEFSPQMMNRFNMNGKLPGMHGVEPAGTHGHHQHPAHYWQYREIASECMKCGETNFVIEHQIPLPSSVIYANTYGRITVHGK